MSKTCFQCGKKGAKLYGYTICDVCESKLGLFTDATIKKHSVRYNSQKKHSLAEEIRTRLNVIEKDYIKKRIKLLHILDRLHQIKK